MTVTVTRYCEECDTELDIDCSVTGCRMNESFWGRPVSWDETEVQFESETKCPGCGEQFDEDRLVDEATELAAEYV